MHIAHVDQKLIDWFRKVSIPAARIALFVIFFWFGILKVVGLSPAEGLVESLFVQTIPFIPFAIFYICFGILECAIGILFLVPKATRIVIPLLLLHMVTTFMPLILLPQLTWQGIFVPTLEGQYIIKNLAIIAVAIGIAAQISPLKTKNT